MFNRLTLIIFLCFTPNLTAGEKTIEYLGDALAVMIPASAYVSTFYMDDHDGQIQFYKSIATSTATTFALKYTVKRERPDGSNDRSFPSAHTMFAFQSATFIHQRYGFTYAIAAYLGATFVGYSRIEADKHYLSDVLAGAAIGSLSSWFFTDRYKSISLQPMAKEGAYGVILAYRW
ncbi:MAG: phosphatase PAP2 family protein [Helicobacteraceae bacterium]|jgi:membrane-associated phospholipid phosphatase|nr:phosphatase PAP2 family protein [Helicobacteraceae bacterium]